MNLSRPLSATLLALLAGTARAQCDFSIASVPDFDQNRQVTVVWPGLPNNGAYYCVPTSITNWFAYFANHGLTQPQTLNGWHDWSSDDNYALVNETIALMGDLLETNPFDPNGGTDPDLALPGIIEYSNTYAQGQVNAYFQEVYDGSDITPINLYWIHLTGGYIAGVYGFYIDDGGGKYTRNGGHCITVNGVSDACSFSPQFSFRNPASDPANHTQSDFLTHTVDLDAVTGQFRLDATDDYQDLTLYRLDYGTTPRFLDRWYILNPKCVLTGFVEAAPAGDFIRVIQPGPPFTVGRPSEMTYHLNPNIGHVKEVLTFPGRTYRIIYSTGGPPPLPSKVFSLNAATGQTVELATGNDISAITFNRFGELYILDGNQLRLLNVSGAFPTQIASLTLAAAPLAIAYDDRTDTLALITPPVAGFNRLVRHTRTLSSVQSNQPFPAGVSIEGTASMDFDRDGDLWVHSTNGSTFTCRQNANGVQLLQILTLPAGHEPQSICLTDSSHLVYSSGGILHECVPTAGGQLQPVPNSAFAGRQAGPRASITRSRTNHDPALHTSPGMRDVPETASFPGVPDCYANCDNSTGTPRLTANDFQCFLNKYASGDPDANCDASTGPPLLTANDFQCFLNKFAAGCP